MSEPTSPSFFRTLTILYGAFIISIVMFLLIAFGLRLSGSMAPYMTEIPEQILVPVVAAFVLIGYVIGRMLFSARLRALQTGSGLSAKTTAYQSAVIIRAALMEGPCLLAIVAFILTGYYSLAIVALAGLIGMALLFPTKSRMLQDLALSYEEQVEMEGPAGSS